MNSRRSLRVHGALSRGPASFLVALVLAAAPHAALAQDPDSGPNPHHEAARLIAAEFAMQDASSTLASLAAQQPSGLTDSMRHELAVAAASYRFRQAARQEQLRVYELAGYASVESAVVTLVAASVQGPLEEAIAALHSL